MSFIREQYTTLPIPTQSQAGKTVVVVGANVGLGFEAAKHIARLSPDKLIITSRDLEKGEKAKKAIQDETGYMNVHLLQLDLSSFESVRKFADEFQENTDAQIHTLLLNAAMATDQYSATVDGWDASIQVNFASSALLSLLLLPTLIASSTPDALARIVVVSSGAHKMIKSLKTVLKEPNMLIAVNKKECNIKASPSYMGWRYPMSKFLHLAFFLSLSSRLSTPHPVLLALVDPGFCATRLKRAADVRPVTRALALVAELLLARSAEAGSRTLAGAACAPEREAHARDGAYLASCKVAPMSPYLATQEGKVVVERVWEETIETLQAVDPRVRAIVSKHVSSSS